MELNKKEQELISVVLDGFCVCKVLTWREFSPFDCSPLARLPLRNNLWEMNKIKNKLSMD